MGMGLKDQIPLDTLWRFLNKIGSFFDSAFPKLQMALYKNPRLEISLLSTIWVSLQVKSKCQSGKVTEVIHQTGLEVGTS